MRALIPMCADKYAVRTYITAKGYGDTLNELYGVYDNVDDIDFNSLPDQFVMKMNNASGRNYICTDKSKCNWSLIKHQFADWLLDHDFAWETGEWQYALIQPRIIIEKYLSNLGQKSLVDYKFHCFNGQVLSCLTCYDREDEFVKLDDYNLEWSRTEDILPSWHAKDRQMLPKPISYDRMIQMAEICTKEFEYCRFDVYEIDGKILFGEMTFTPHGGVLDYYSDDFRIRNKNLIK
ncbi:MAG: hypothetical protein MJZ20_04860 [Bacteroidaceae bacterium]|nr:hypothetical protein [Bacteroidaceae bacterium]